jgi:hypothetical protein
MLFSLPVVADTAVAAVKKAKSGAAARKVVQVKTTLTTIILKRS